MRKLLLVILLGVSYPAFSLCVDEYCSTSPELERQARQLNAAYQRLQSFSRTHDNSITDNAFIEAQKRWRAWVPVECELAYAPLQAGNMASDIYIFFYCVIFIVNLYLILLYLTIQNSQFSNFSNLLFLLYHLSYLTNYLIYLMLVNF